jgi:hypothetical protein
MWFSGTAFTKPWAEPPIMKQEKEKKKILLSKIKISQGQQVTMLKIKSDQQQS